MSPHHAASWAKLRRADCGFGLAFLSSHKPARAAAETEQSLMRTVRLGQ